MLALLFIILSNPMNGFHSLYDSYLQYYVPEAYDLTNNDDIGYCIEKNDDKSVCYVVGQCYGTSKSFIGMFYEQDASPYIVTYNLSWNSTDQFCGITRSIENDGLIVCGTYYNQSYMRQFIGYFDDELTYRYGWGGTTGGLVDVCKIGKYYYACGAVGSGTSRSKVIYKFNSELAAIDTVEYGYGCQYFSIKPTLDGCLIAVGDAYGGNGLLKCDTNLNYLWGKSIGGSSVYPTSDGGYIIAGDRGSGNMWLRKVDSIGNDLWINYYATSYIHRAGLDVIEDSNHEKGFLIVGSVRDSSSSSNDNDIFILHTDSSGNEEWSIILDGLSSINCNDQAFSCHEMNNIYYITGVVGVDTIHSNNLSLAVISVCAWPDEQNKEIIISTGSEKAIIPSIGRILQNECKINFQIIGQDERNLNFSIYNVLGQRVYTDIINCSNNSISWNKMDYSNHEVPAGSYFAVIDDGMSRFSKSFVILE